MTVNAARLREFVNVGAGNDTEIDECIAAARDLVESHVGSCAEDVPNGVYERAWLLVAAEMFNQGQAPNGIINQQYDEGAGAVIRIGSDPMRPAYPLLARFIPPRLA